MFEFENINVYSFDLNQYNPNAECIHFVVFANYNGKSYTSNTVHVSSDSCLRLVDESVKFLKWIPKPNSIEIIKLKGLLDIQKAIDLKLKENELEF